MSNEQRGHRALVVALAVLGVFVTYVPITAVSVALARIGITTGASTSDLQWVSDAYVIPLAAAVLPAGLFGDRQGRRRVFLIGMALTVIGAGIAGLSGLATGASAIHLLWIGQAVSGLGAGLLLPTTLALIAHVVPDPKARGKFIGLWATGLLVGLAVGPLIAGVILDHTGYGWTFLPTVGLALLALVVAALRLPESKAPQARNFDVPGQISSVIAIAALIFGLIEGGASSWSDPLTVTGLSVGVAALVCFLLVEMKAAAPLVDLSLFRSSAFTVAGLSAMVALFSVVGVMFLVSLYLGEVQHLTPLQIGLRLLFVTAVAAIVNPAVSVAVQKIRVGYLLAGGLAAGALGVFLLIGLDADTGLLDLGWRLAVFGVSIAVMLTSVSVVAVNAVPWQQAGMASAANTLLRQLGGALGPAVLGVIFVDRTRAGETPESALHTVLVVNGILLVVAMLACLTTVRRAGPGHHDAA